MGYLVVGTPLNLEGILVSPILQWIYGTFTLISIVAIICAGVGTLYHIESHLNFYAWVLLISTIVDICFFVVFVLYGRSCKTKHSDENHLVATISCGLQDGMVLLCLTFLVAVKVVALLIVNKCKNYVHTAYSQALIPFVAEHFANLEAAKERAWDKHHEPLASTHSMRHSVPRTTVPATVLPNIRSDCTKFDSYRPPAAFPPGSMMPSMGPTMGYGANGSVRHIATIG